MAKTAADRAFDKIQKFSDLPSEVQARIAREAIAASEDFGYCDETSNVLEAIGFSAPEKRVKVVVETDDFCMDGLDDLASDKWRVHVTIEHETNGRCYELWDSRVVKVEDLKK